VTVTGHTTNWAGSTRAIYTTIGGLKPLSAYDFEVTADNSAGASTPGISGTVVIAPTSACAGATLTDNPPSALAQPGSSVKVTATLENGCSDSLDDAQLLLFAPSGYQVVPGSAQDAGTVAAGTTAAMTWTVTIPSNATSSAVLLTQAVFSEGGQSEGLQSKSTVNVPAASLDAAFDNVGVTNDTDTTVGDIDGAGSSFSAQALDALGATPGATITAGGISFTWPNVAAGNPDNVVANGSAFDLSGSGSTLSFLLTASYGPASGTGEVVYTDGTTSSFTLSAPDWHGGCTTPPSSSTALQMAYRNRATGQNQLPVCVYDASAQLTSGKTVSMVILPDVSSGVASGTAALHVFAVTIS
jgi:beta-glucosidase